MTVLSWSDSILWQVNDSALPEHVQSRLRLGRSDTSGPGYFKVQPAGERLGNCLHYKGHASGENSEQSFGGGLVHLLSRALLSCC